MKDYVIENILIFGRKFSVVRDKFWLRISWFEYYLALTISTYDGNVETSVTEDTTHIIVKDDMSDNQKEVICLVILLL